VTCPSGRRIFWTNDLVGRKVKIMNPEKPQTLNGFFSQGMILCLVIIFFIVGCGHSDEYVKFHKMCKDIPKKYNSDDIRKAVLPLFVEYKRHPLLAGGSGILDSDVPKEIKSLPFFPDAHWIDTSWIDNTNEGLMFVTGGGFGHFGIIVYQNKNHRDGNGPSYETVPWTNGIYFYNELR
jgi:tRNA-binding EMAP/Myf-like protein